MATIQVALGFELFLVTIGRRTRTAVDSTATVATTTAGLMAITAIVARLPGNRSAQEMLEKLSAENTTDRKVQADVKKYGEISVREKGAADSEEAAYKRAQESQKAYRRSATKESTKTSCALSRFPGLDMAKYLARSCPRCNCYVEIIMAIRAATYRCRRLTATVWAAVIACRGL